MQEKNKTKQVIVIRRDLNMSAGKLAAQVAHASLKSYFATENTPQCNNWLENSYTKVVLYVKSEEALSKLYNKCQEKDIPCSLIMDEGRTELDGPTFTCLGIGPLWEEDFEGITNKLRVFNADVKQI